MADAGSVGICRGPGRDSIAKESSFCLREAGESGGEPFAIVIASVKCLGCCERGGVPYKYIRNAIGSTARDGK
jgi:hypothetical protein